MQILNGLGYEKLEEDIKENSSIKELPEVKDNLGYSERREMSISCMPERYLTYRRRYSYSRMTTKTN